MSTPPSGVSNRSDRVLFSGAVIHVTLATLVEAGIVVRHLQVHEPQTIGSRGVLIGVLNVFSPDR